MTRARFVKLKESDVMQIEATIKELDKMFWSTGISFRTKKGKLFCGINKR